MSKKKKTKEVKNPNMYGYKHDQDVTIKGGVLNEIMRLVEPLLERESEIYFPQVVTWLTQDGKSFDGDPTPEEIKEKKLSRNLQLDQILGQDVKPTIYYTELGRQLLRLQVLLYEAKSKHIDEGVAKTIEELNEAVKMDVVE